MMIKKELRSAEAMNLVTSVDEIGKNKNSYDSDTIIMGKYPQQDSTGKIKEGIEWIVLSKDETNHTALLLSKYILDAKPFTSGSECDWEKSDLRKWLNSDFYEQAFNEDEKDLICNAEYYDHHIISTDTHRDKIFCLGQNEVEAYREFHSLLKAESTEYARNVILEKGTEGAKKLYVYADFPVHTDKAYSPYVLRTVNKDSNNPHYVDYQGNFNKGEYFDLSKCGIRPVMRIHY